MRGRATQGSWRKAGKEKPRRVLILTLPPRSNYGGILQAWALQKTLGDRGYAADTTVSLPVTRPLRRMLIRSLQRINASGLRGKSRKQQVADRMTSAARAQIDKHLIAFVQTRMTSIDIFRGMPRPSRRVLGQYTDFLVGSDQVWRPKYIHVPTALFNFVPQDSDARFFSYAASFGVDHTHEFSDELRRETKKLAQRFAGISVRERSGVDLVSTLWERHDAVHHVDPTMLHGPEVYSELIRSAPSLAGAPAAGGVVSYVLDPSPDKQALGDRVSTHLGVHHEDLLRPDPRGLRSFQQDPSNFEKIPVESWLAAIRDAKALVTDSFHGCVFAILFHVPFVAIPNQTRGAERFKSLLGQFGLGHRLVSESGENLEERVEWVLADPIDWSTVDAQLNRERQRSLEYLEAHLGRETPAKGPLAPEPSAHTPVQTARDLLTRVVDRNLCIGCGACASLEESALDVALDDRGRYRAVAKAGADLDSPGAYGAVCPFASPANEDELASDFLGGEGSYHSDGVGTYRTIHAGWANNGGFRERGSSGGLTSWFLEQLFERDLVDGVLHVVAGEPDEPMFRYGVSTSTESMRSGAKSRYYPVEMSQVLEHVRQTPGRYAVVGVPCFIKSIRLLQKEDPIVRDRIRYCVGLFCGHLKSTRFADTLAWEMGIPPGQLDSIDFRVEGESASRYQVSATATSGQTVTRANNRLLVADWGYGMFKYHACDFCDDVMAETADISFGDAWLPAFSSDPQGTNVIVARSEETAKIIQLAVPEINLVELSAQCAAQSQAAGLRHRREGLSHRLAMQPEAERPKKRVAPTPAPRSRARIYDLRGEVIDLADVAYEQAAPESDFAGFSEKVASWRRKYHRAYRPPLTARIKRRARGVLRRTYRAVFGSGVKLD